MAADAFYIWNGGFMPGSNQKSKKKLWAVTVLLFAAIILAVVLVDRIHRSRKAAMEAPSTASKNEGVPSLIQPQPLAVPIKPKAVLNYNDLEKDQQLKALIEQRKRETGLSISVDLIVKPDESIKVGDTIVPLKEILEQIDLRNEKIIEADIRQPADTKNYRYGIYVVQPGDNIWNIHFKFLKDYLAHRHIAVSPIADEPDRSGFSSGVGKILKFSEKMVYIYNINERRLDVDLNLIEPMSKLVVYNMKEVFALLDQIDYESVHRIEFDGETIWVPANN